MRSVQEECWAQGQNVIWLALDVGPYECLHLTGVGREMLALLMARWTKTGFNGLLITTLKQEKQSASKLLHAVTS